MAAERSYTELMIGSRWPFLMYRWVYAKSSQVPRAQASFDQANGRRAAYGINGKRESTANKSLHHRSRAYDRVLQKTSRVSSDGGMRNGESSAAASRRILVLETSQQLTGDVRVQGVVQMCGLSGAVIVHVRW